jgi:hypothetical protein
MLLSIRILSQHHFWLALPACDQTPSFGKLGNADASGGRALGWMNFQQTPHSIARVTGMDQDIAAQRGLPCGLSCWKKLVEQEPDSSIQTQIMQNQW